MKIVEFYVQQNGDHFNIMADGKKMVLIDFDSYEAADHFLDDLFNGDEASE